MSAQGVREHLITWSLARSSLTFTNQTTRTHDRKKCTFKQQDYIYDKTFEISQHYIQTLVWNIVIQL